MNTINLTSSKSNVTKSSKQNLLELEKPKTKQTNKKNQQQRDFPACPQKNTQRGAQLNQLK